MEFWRVTFYHKESDTWQAAWFQKEYDAYCFSSFKMKANDPEWIMARDEREKKFYEMLCADTQTQFL